MLYSTHSHGGQLHVASKQYNIPVADWLDLSTGINPVSYPLPDIPIKCWQRLPETNDGLEKAAANYYGSEYLLPVAGSQEAIQRLPLLRPNNQRVGILSPAYHSHHQAWSQAGHHVCEISSQEIDSKLPELDVLVIVNPTNPTAETFTRETLLNWHDQLTRHNGWLIIDEAFIDSTPEKSLISTAPKKGLIVLRSIGKFFGLAGIRLGFVWAETEVLKQLAHHQDDWSVSHPARWAGKVALQDTLWQQQQRKELSHYSLRLKNLLENHFQVEVHHTALFAYFAHPNAVEYHHQLARRGILTRLFESPVALRFGLPDFGLAADKQQWQQLKNSLHNIKIKGMG